MVSFRVAGLPLSIFMTTNPIMNFPGLCPRTASRSSTYVAASARYAAESKANAAFATDPKTNMSRIPAIKRFRTSALPYGGTIASDSRVRIDQRRPVRPWRARLSDAANPIGRVDARLRRMLRPRFVAAPHAVRDRCVSQATFFLPRREDCRRCGTDLWLSGATARSSRGTGSNSRFGAGFQPANALMIAWAAAAT